MAVGEILIYAYEFVINGGFQSFRHSWIHVNYYNYCDHDLQHFYHPIYTYITTSHVEHGIHSDRVSCILDKHMMF